jgi:predicted GH43/DUF377 family glycosyl hydrolase
MTADSPPQRGWSQKVPHSATNDDELEGSETAGWQLGPFTRCPEPLLQRDTARWWASKDLFNPGAVVHEGRVHLLVRGEDDTGRFAGTSRVGLATSDDGFAFELEPEPVLLPGDGRWQAWETAGCEDPRVVESPDGGFACLYTGFDGKAATLMVATSSDLRHWTKHGPAFTGTPQARRWSKSGSVVCELRHGRLVAARIDGRYWMYWGEGIVFAATSRDLVRWEPVCFDATADRYLVPRPAPAGADPAGQCSLAPNGDSAARSVRAAGGHRPVTTAPPGADAATPPWDITAVPGQQVLRPVLHPRSGRFDSLLAEPGPPALLTEDGIVLVYNGANHPKRGDPSLAAWSYQPGQALLDPRAPASCLARCTEPFLRAEAAGERSGQVANVCFAQGLVLFAGRWHLYFGMADSRIGCATAPAG